MSVFSDYPFAKKSVYGHDYVPKQVKIKRYTLDDFPKDYENPLTGPWEEHVLPRFKYERLEKPTDQQNPVDYVQELLVKKPDLKHYLEYPPYGPPDFDRIDKFYDGDGRSNYHVSYCKKGDFESKKTRELEIHELPEGRQMPATTYGASYRGSKAFPSDGLPPPKDNLDPNHRAREILQVKTGETDYQAIIGETGRAIIKDHLFGDTSIRPKFDPEDLFKAKLLRK